MAVIGNNNITSTAKNICYSASPGTFTATTPTGGSGSYTYNWQQAPYPAGSPWTNCPGASTVMTNFNYINAITSSLLIRRVVHSVGYTDSISAPQVLTVYAVMAAGNVSGTQTICYNSAPTQFTSLQAGSGGAPPGAYNWQKSTNNSTWSNADGTRNQATYTVPAPLTSTMYYRRQWVASPCTTVQTASITVTVSAQLAGGSISGDANVCSGVNVPNISNVTPGSGGSGASTYGWEKNVNGGFQIIAGETNNFYAPGESFTNPSTTSVVYRRSYTNTCGTAYSNIITYTIRPVFVVGALNPSDNQTIQPGEQPNQISQGTLPTGGSAPYIYLWKYSTNMVDWINLAETTAYYQPPVLQQTTYYRRFDRDTICQSTPLQATNTITITINAHRSSGLFGDNKKLLFNGKEIKF